MLKLLASKRM